MANVEATGRITLPPPARRTLGVVGDRPATVGARVRRGSLQLSACGRADGGAVVTVDGRARLVLPVGLRHAACSAGVVLVGASPSAAIVVVTATSRLDWLGDALVSTP